MILDPSTNVGKIRLRIADYSDLPYLSDAVITSTLTDSNNNLPQAAKTCAVYILGMLSHKTHRKLNQLEVWGAEAFQNYKDFLILTVSNPNFMSFSPIPFVSTLEFDPIQEFTNDWNKNYAAGTESQQLARNALWTFNDNSLYGNFGNFSI